MQLTPQETSDAFWSGIRHGAGRTLTMLIGGATFVACVAATLAGAGVLMCAGILLGGIGAAAAVTLISGQQALTEYHQKKHNDLYEARITRLEGLSPQQEFGSQDRTRSPHVERILNDGARTKHSHADAEEQRAAEAEAKGPTIH